jgi:16S rRNA processing protein RimM
MPDGATGISAGRVGRPHGLDGSCHVTRPTARLLALGTTATVGGRQREIVRRAGTDANPIVRFEGVDGREAAELLRGEEILIAAAELPALESGEFWAHELEGCTVVAAAGPVLGVVRRVIELPSCEALEVERAASAAAGAVGSGWGASFLVPMVKDAVRGIDVGARRIEVDAAFLDLAGAQGGDEA